MKRSNSEHDQSPMSAEELYKKYIQLKPRYLDDLNYIINLQKSRGGVIIDADISSEIIRNARGACMKS